MAEKQRKKKRKKTGLWIFLMMLCAAAGATGYFYREKQTAQAEEEQVMTVGENQEILYGEITDIVGNEMKLAMAEYGTAQGRASYTMTGEEREYQIPVGTEVETKLGAVTTFSRLASGDMVEMLVEKDGADGCILKIQIVE